MTEREPRTAVLVAHADEAFREHAREVLGASGLDVELVADAETCLRRMFGDAAAPAPGDSGQPLQSAFGVVVVQQELGVEPLRLYEELRARDLNIRIIVVTADPDPDLIAGMLYARIDDLIVGERPRGLAERVHEAFDRQACLPGFEIISAAPHWIEVRIPATSDHFKWLRRFLDALEESLPGGERTKIMFALAELARAAVEQNKLAAQQDATVSIACYRFDQVRIIRVHADERVSFTLPAGATEHDDRDLVIVGVTNPIRRQRERVTNPWLEVVARFADHFITSGSGNEVMLVRMLGEAED